MLERNRIIKESYIFDGITLDKLYTLSDARMYKNKILDIVKKLYLENPQCFNDDVVSHKIALAKALADSYGMDITDYYHYTSHDNDVVTGIRYQPIPLDEITAQEYLDIYQYLVILNIVQYQIDGAYGHELLGTITYNRQTKDLIINNIGLIEKLDNNYNGYMYQQDCLIPKPFVKIK